MDSLQSTYGQPPDTWKQLQVSRVTHTNYGDTPATFKSTCYLRTFNKGCPLHKIIYSKTAKPQSATIYRELTITGP